MLALLPLLESFLFVEVEMVLNCCWGAEIDVAKESSKALSLVIDEAKCDRVAFVELDKSSNAEAALLKGFVESPGLSVSSACAVVKCFLSFK